MRRNPLRAGFEGLAVTLASERVVRSAEDAMTLRLGRLLRWGVRLEERFAREREAMDSGS